MAGSVSKHGAGAVISLALNSIALATTVTALHFSN